MTCKTSGRRFLFIIVIIVICFIIKPIFYILLCSYVHCASALQSSSIISTQVLAVTSLGQTEPRCCERVETQRIHAKHCIWKLEFFRGHVNVTHQFVALTLHFQDHSTSFKNACLQKTALHRLCLRTKATCQEGTNRGREGGSGHETRHQQTVEIVQERMGGYVEALGA